MNDISWCINYLKEKNNIKSHLNLDEEKALRALMNISMPVGFSDEFYLRQDKALKEIRKNEHIVTLDEMKNIKDNFYLYQGDITLIKADAIVNACNEKLLGCFSPLHGCIDNAIHSFAGLQVRRDLINVMNKQNHDEPNGQCKITDGYNLPSRYILHTVGPVYTGSVQNETDLASCYKSCLKMVDEHHLKSVVFCSLSTGVYSYPIDQASHIALKSVKEYLNGRNDIKVIFNVFSSSDYDVYLENMEKYL